MCRRGLMRERTATVAARGDTSSREIAEKTREVDPNMLPVLDLPVHGLDWNAEATSNRRGSSGLSS